MYLQDEGAASARRFVPGEDVVASGCDGLALRANAQVAEEVFEVGGDAVLEKVGAVEVAAHWVDARQGDQIAQEMSGFVHEDAHEKRYAKPALSASEGFGAEPLAGAQGW